MSKFFKKILCKIGIHKWICIFSAPIFMNTNTDKRTTFCEHCGKEK